MRNASGHQGENEWQRKKKSEQEHVQHSFLKRLTRKVSRCSRAKQRQRNYKKKCAARAKFSFANKTYWVFSAVFVTFAA